MSGGTSGRRTDYRQLGLLTQTTIYGLYISAFLCDTFEEQIRGALSLSAGLAGVGFESEEQANAAIDRAAKAACAVLLEHGRLIRPEEIAAAWQRRGGQT